MPNRAKLVGQSTGWRRLKASIGLVLAALAGCFGPPTMHYDVQEYNKQVVSSEQQMLLYNIGRLNQNQPPHFMMVSSVSQTRTFSGGTSFQWMTNPSIWTVGPFTAGGVENPTITFVPIQGQDFAQRFESPLTDKFTLFLEDRAWYSESTEPADIVMLFAQSLNLYHGDSKQCPAGLYVNRHLHQDEVDSSGNQQSIVASSQVGQQAMKDLYISNQAVQGSRDSESLFKCVKEITRTTTDSVLIDASHLIPTKQSEDPKAADLVTALQAGYKWTKAGDKFVLANAVKIPAWFDYTPEFATPSEPKKPESSAPIFWVQKKPPWQGLQYTLPKGYTWKTYKVNQNAAAAAEQLYALIPDGYDLERYPNGELKRDKNGYPVLAEVKAEGPSSEALRFSYGDEIANDLWPVPQNYFYVELRENTPEAPIVTDAIAERACFPHPDKSVPVNNVVCGYFKIGNLLQIMQRLADMACKYPYPEKKPVPADCSQSIFGMGDSVPSWADTSAPYQHRLTGPYVWVPAHNPILQPELADRDRKTFFNLYKLYQLSLVDTSKLVTGAPPVTISK